MQCLQTTDVSAGDWIGMSSVLRPREHSIGYIGDGFYRSKDPTNSIKVLKEKTTRTPLYNADEDYPTRPEIQQPVPE